MNRMNGMSGFERADLTERIIGCAMRVHGVLGSGFLEAVYQRALEHELGKAGLRVECERPIGVLYDGILVGDYIADMVVEGEVIIENKAVKALSPVHEIQLLHYLSATGINVGLLLNFGSPRLQIRRKARIITPQAASI